MTDRPILYPPRDPAAPDGSLAALRTALASIVARLLIEEQRGVQSSQEHQQEGR
ncbi:hypothetical protein [Kallotenue papyrolyticum]|uniref:hypothetical protein n=1 Tax=Kallotenue papyrolyticum TaxID=1325125 RepID=UPI0013770691|nr:hypothetical protein [Kallotenue papyrolyticum]